MDTSATLDPSAVTTSPSNQDQARPRRQTLAPDHALRKRLFWRVLLGAAAIVVGSHAFQRVVSYELVGDPWMKFGSFGYWLARFPDKAQLGDKKAVYLLGNSVYQHWHVGEEMIKLAAKENPNLALFNLSQSGSGANDHILQAAKALNYNPALLVVSVESRNVQTYKRFHTDGDQMVFDPDVLSTLPWSFYQSRMGFEDKINSAISTAIPLRRLDPMIRHKLRLRQKLPKWFFDRVSYPTMNTREEWNMQIMGRRFIPHSEGDSKYDDTVKSFQELVDLVKAHNVPIAFIVQESKANPDIKDIYPALQKIAATYDKAFVYDLQHFWDQKTFADHVHPLEPALGAYTRRHYGAVTQTLNKLGIL